MILHNDLEFLNFLSEEKKFLSILNIYNLKEDVIYLNTNKEYLIKNKYKNIQIVLATNAKTSKIILKNNCEDENTFNKVYKIFKMCYDNIYIK